MKIRFISRSIMVFSFFFFSLLSRSNDFEKIAKNDAVAGFFTYYYDDSSGEIYLKVEELNQDFLYVEALATGIGSNDIGLDRGQLGDQRVVHFEKAGPKLFLVENNLKYRSSSSNEAENQSIEEAFAQSVLASFPIVEEKNDAFLINLTPFLLRDAHGVSKVLAAKEQGNYSLDLDCSAMYLPMTKNFPKNTEFEVTLTFSGAATDREIISVSPNSSIITLRQHHSFVELPDENFKMRSFDPRMGYFSLSYFDYSVSMDQEIEKRFITRHRLEKVDPNAAISEAVEPIMYYLDPGTPEPVRSALMEGALWWNQAFEAAGYKNAFQVKVLPDSADPLDVRYNMIQWVHRSTRGWSYGSAVVDPRTGEIIKGHVSLGSLRIRQDYLIACGLISPYDDESISEEAKAMALARIRQLSAHEVGHTLGLAHNYSASMDDDASVMDYPHPNVKITNGQIDLSDAYDQKIGEWDKMTILYGYQDFPKDIDEKEALKDIVYEAYVEKELSFISDQDARPQGSAHPRAHLWDNGNNAATQLEQIMEVRKVALNNFSEKAIKPGQSMSLLEEALAPIYFMHRYQVEAAAKVIGGYNYSYAMRGDGQEVTSFVDPIMQQEALDAILLTLEPSALALKEEIIVLIPPKPMGYYRSRESMPSKTAMLFDPIAIAGSASELTLNLLLNPERANRLVDFNYRNKAQPSLESVFSQLINFCMNLEVNSGLEREISHLVIQNAVYQMMLLANDSRSNIEVVAITSHAINDFKERLIELDNKNVKEDHDILHFTIDQINKYQKDPESISVPELIKAPDGSPIGCGL